MMFIDLFILFLVHKTWEYINARHLPPAVSSTQVVTDHVLNYKNNIYKLLTLYIMVLLC